MPIALLGDAVQTAALFSPAYWTNDAVTAALTSPSITEELLLRMGTDVGVTLLFAVAFTAVGLALGRARPRRSREVRMSRTCAVGKLGLSEGSPPRRAKSNGQRFPREVPFAGHRRRLADESGSVQPSSFQLLGTSPRARQVRVNGAEEKVHLRGPAPSRLRRGYSSPSPRSAQKLQSRSPSMAKPAIP